MIRRGVVGLIALLLVCGTSVAAGGVAMAAPTDSTQPTVTTVTFHGTQTLERTNLCTGDAVAITESTNAIQHVVLQPSTGVRHVTTTIEDTFTGVDTLTGVMYRGHDVNHATCTPTSTTRALPSPSRSGQ